MIRSIASAATVMLAIFAPDQVRAEGHGYLMWQGGYVRGPGYPDKPAACLRLESWTPADIVARCEGLKVEERVETAPQYHTVTLAKVASTHDKRPAAYDSISITASELFAIGSAALTESGQRQITAQLIPKLAEIAKLKSQGYKISEATALYIEGHACVVGPRGSRARYGWRPEMLVPGNPVRLESASGRRVLKYLEHSQAFNQKLSQSRAQAVFDFVKHDSRLAEAGIAAMAHDKQVQGFGFLQPPGEEKELRLSEPADIVQLLAANDTEAKRVANRRFEISFVSRLTRAAKSIPTGYVCPPAPAGAKFGSQQENNTTCSWKVVSGSGGQFLWVERLDWDNCRGHTADSCRMTPR